MEKYLVWGAIACVIYWVIKDYTMDEENYKWLAEVVKFIVFCAILGVILWAIDALVQY